jgi:hypothetical protein
MTRQQLGEAPRDRQAYAPSFVHMHCKVFTILPVLLTRSLMGWINCPFYVAEKLTSYSYSGVDIRYPMPHLQLPLCSVEEDRCIPVLPHADALPGVDGTVDELCVSIGRVHEQNPCTQEETHKRE